LSADAEYYLGDGMTNNWDALAKAPDSVLALAAEPLTVSQQYYGVTQTWVC